MNFIVGRMIISAMRTSLTNPHHCTATWQAPHRWRNVAQGSRSSLAALPPRRAMGGAAWMFSKTVCGVKPSPKQIVLYAPALPMTFAQKHHDGNRHGASFVLVGLRRAALPASTLLEMLIAPQLPALAPDQRKMIAFVRVTAPQRAGVHWSSRTVPICGSFPWRRHRRPCRFPPAGASPCSWKPTPSHRPSHLLSRCGWYRRLLAPRSPIHRGGSGNYSYRCDRYRLFASPCLPASICCESISL